MSPARSAVYRLIPWMEVAGFASAVSAVAYIAVSRHPEIQRDPLMLFAHGPHPETTFTGLALLAAPAVWWLGRSRQIPVPPPVLGSEKLAVDASQQPERSTAAMRRSTIGISWLVSTLLFTLHVALTWSVGHYFHGMPPAYHDEYSYIVQAKTFLAGRLFFPTHQLPEFFDQMHVLNDNGVFASRYFPGVGLWMMPWVAMGQPYWGQYLAGGLIVVCVFWIGRDAAAGLAEQSGAVPHERRLFDGLIAIVAATLCGVSPAMLLFGNLLLSHHPTTLGLALFVLGYLRALRSDGIGWPLVAGIALGFAMLCRPLTAFGFALPFGVYLVGLWAQKRLSRPAARLGVATVPILLALGLLATHNAAITGTPFQSPYGLYTQIYTPNHGYGFHNVSRGSRHESPKVLENYNRWAEELTVPRAAQLAWRRGASSASWSIGRVNLAFLGAAFLLALPRLPATWKLLAAAMLALHAVYFPFGFEGIFHLSYVFESVPVICLLAAGTAGLLLRHWSETGRWAKAVWLGAFVVLGLAGPIDGLIRPGPEGGISQVRFARSHYAQFDERLRAAGVQTPAIVFVHVDPDDRHLDLVTNSPSLDDPILRVRDRGSHNLELLKLYPERDAWHFDARTGRLARIDRRKAD